MSSIHRTDTAGLDLQVHRSTIQSLKNVLNKEMHGESASPQAGATLDYINMSIEDKQDLQKKVEELNESIASSGKEIHFKYHDDAKELYVEVIDKKTKEVIASLPPEFLIDLSVKMKELIGLFLDKKV
ncbi:flagellar protein FlaG [Paenibacillus thiaminolyticus]|uniref:Flagellar protein FlaG n=1 Tax=Paenibacillus thiaminolyticus TaxID=49283 RepID=A0AAJ1G9F7_PANTH|nr:flagellar protein FlaG [Paenibacillus thiaminolyticus]MCY9538198.1 flagellar protein FlaG [Paenibacillus thiaminolyticus]MCY9602816.1 flagellar protein FlaG [Paenibacillus thiaminolyticus]MCY9610801.1 flagellar protein FlaG [Paenibacillus thiaminolyticus]MCY9615072.1 flagellar protein FlaG [Paenibacillus thiaminolyticus]MCY9621313.1 flagellar protein FlaG [Paenibacillus thiaminolyticus]